jgi:hypothetical protein
MDLLRKISSMISRAKVSNSLPDTGKHPITQISLLGKTANTEVIWPYGMNGRLPGDAQVLCFNVEGMEENKACIGNVPTLRIKVDAEGEVCFGNPLTGSVIYFRENGDTEEVGTNDKTSTITGDSSETITGTKNITTDIAANITAPIINIGSSGATLRKLIDERFEALFNVHVHLDPVTGTTGPPTVLLTPGAQTTTDTKAS